MISDAVYVYAGAMLTRTARQGDVFARTDLIEQAGLTQPRLVKLHTSWATYFRCKTEAEFLVVCERTH